jgi:hypothetical protein
MAQLTYCGNVHPTQCFGDLLSHLNGPSSEVAKAFGASEGNFPLGLWLPRSAIVEAQGKVETLRRQLEVNGLSVATFNAFPMDVFHGQEVKDGVYRPDWGEKARLEYTIAIGELAASLGLEDVSISTVSGGFRLNDNEEKVTTYLEHWLAFVAWARGEEERSGCCVRLALEPEPFNTMEDHRDAMAIWPRLREKADLLGIDQHSLDRHLGLCFDTCHFSVRFVEPLKAWLELEKAGVPVHKVQVSVAPRGVGAEGLEALLSLDEPVYLHQTYHRDTEGTLREYLDLKFIDSDIESEGEWRTHFHVPIHWGERPDTTGYELIPLLEHFGRCGSPLLEVETYSFDALPGSKKVESLTGSIVEELRWCREILERGKVD